MNSKDVWFLCEWAICAKASWSRTSYVLWQWHARAKIYTQCAYRQSYVLPLHMSLLCACLLLSNKLCCFRGQQIAVSISVSRETAKHKALSQGANTKHLLPLCLQRRLRNQYCFEDSLGLGSITSTRILYGSQGNRLMCRFICNTIHKHTLAKNESQSFTQPPCKGLTRKITVQEK